MSQVVARDSGAADHLVYPWPYPLGAQIEVSCADGEVAVMCPAWAVGDRLGPGRHSWRSPDPTKPVSVYFVLTGPVQVEFDMLTQFTLPSTGQAATLRAQGSVLVRVPDPGLLVAQFVGLPFDRVNAGLVHSVASSVERMLGKVLPRKVAMMGNVGVVADPATWPALMDELTSYNPAMGAVYGVEFVRFNQLAVTAGDAGGGWNGQAVGEWHPSQETTARQMVSSSSSQSGQVVSGEINSDPALAPPPTAPPAMAPVGQVPEMPPGTRVLVALADGLLHSAIVRQALQGYYELEVGDTGETVWVPMTQVAPQL